MLGASLERSHHGYLDLTSNLDESVAEPVVGDGATNISSDIQAMELATTAATTTDDPHAFPALINTLVPSTAIVENEERATQPETKRSLDSAKVMLAKLIKKSELREKYHLVVGNVLRLKNVLPTAYQFHPDTISELAIFHQWLRCSIQAGPEHNQVERMGEKGQMQQGEPMEGIENIDKLDKSENVDKAEKAEAEETVLALPPSFIHLVAKLLQDCTQPDPTLLHEILIPKCDSTLTRVRLQWMSPEINFVDWVNHIASFTYYGLGDCPNPTERQKYGCGVWEVRELGLLGPHIAAEVLKNRTDRELSSKLLNELYYQKGTLAPPPLSPPSLQSMVISEEQKIESAEPIPKTLSKLAMSKNLIVKQAMPSANPNQKLSSFFTVTKKSQQFSMDNLEEKHDFFQPFYVKPSVIVAPINNFEIIQSTISSHDPLHRLINRPNISCMAKRGRKRACCLGFSSGPMLVVIKLLQFHTNYRPAYYGSWRKMSKHITGRRPFVKDIELEDYDLDSDDEWGDDEDIGEVDSINSDDEVEEEEEDESDESDSWMVPHGYLSEDEGGGEHCEFINSSKEPSKRFGEKKGLTILHPLIFGPFYQSIPSTSEYFAGTCLEFMAIKSKCLSLVATIRPWVNPFEGIRSSEESMIGSCVKAEEECSKSGKMTGGILPDSLLSPLAILINGSTLGLARLYESFVNLYGLVSKRQFELRINQIAYKHKNGEQGKKAVWTIRQEYANLLSVTELANQTANI